MNMNIIVHAYNFINQKVNCHPKGELGMPTEATECDQTILMLLMMMTMMMMLMIIMKRKNLSPGEQRMPAEATECNQTMLM